MAKDKKGVGDISEALKSIFERIGDFFSLFDLSFLVSGAVCLGAVVVGAQLAGATQAVRFFNPAEWPATHTIVVVLICYVLGLVCFALGRILQTQKKSELYAVEFRQSLEDHGLMDRYRAHFVVKDKRDSSGTLYTLLWVRLRQVKELAPSLQLLMRYWVMAALFDGLVAAGAVWLFIFAWALSQRTIEPFAGGAAVIAIAIAMILCKREAYRYAKYQIRELVATIAWHEAERAQHAQPQNPPVIAA